MFRDLAAALIQAKRGVYSPEVPKSSVDLFLLDFLIVTFWNLIESKGKVEEEIGDLSENISNEFKIEGSIKEEVMGLEGLVDVIGVVFL